MDVNDIFDADEDFDSILKDHPDHGCHDCRSMKMYACAQGRPAYPNGGPDQCKPQRKTTGWRPRAL